MNKLARCFLPLALTAATALAALAPAGCSKTNACRSATVLYHLSLGTRGSAATTIDVETTVAGVKHTDSGTRSAGAHAAVEIAFPGGYPAGQTVAVTVTLRDASGVVARASDQFTATGSCLARDLTVADGAGNDGGGGNGGSGGTGGTGGGTTDAASGGTGGGGSVSDGSADVPRDVGPCGRSCGMGACTDGECRPWLLNPVVFAYPVDWFTVNGNTLYLQTGDSTGGEDIMSMSIEGGATSPVVTHYGKLQGAGARIMADDQAVYYYEAGGRYYDVHFLDGSAPPTTTGHSGMDQPVLAGNYVFYVDATTNALGRFDKLTGLNPLTLVPSGILHSPGYADPAFSIVGTRAYYIGAQGRNIMWVPIDGGTPISLYGNSGATFVAVSAAGDTVFASMPDNVMLIQDRGTSRNQVIYRDPPNQVGLIVSDQTAVYMFVGTTVDAGTMRVVPTALLRLRVGEVTATKIADIAGATPSYTAAIDATSVYYSVGPRIFRVMK